MDKQDVSDKQTMRTPSAFVLIALRTFRRRSALSAPRSINLWLRRKSIHRFVGVLLAIVGGLSSSARAGSSNSLMDISADGKYLACSNRDSGTLTIVTLADNTKLHEIKVGSHPEGVSFIGDSYQVAVAVYDEDKIVFVAADSAKWLGHADVFDEPYGVVSRKDGSKIYVTLDYPGQIVEIDPATKKQTRSFVSGPFSRGLAIDPDEKRLYVTEFYTSTVRAIDIKTGKAVDEWSGGSTDNLARQIVLNPRRPKAYLPHIRSRVNEAHGSGSIFPYLAVPDTRPGEGRRRRRVPMDTFGRGRITANPWEVGINPDGRQLYIVFAGTNELFAADIVDDDYREVAFRQMIVAGNNPRAVRVAPDNKTVYVYNALDFQVLALRTSNLSRVATIDVTKNPLTKEVHRGKILFYSSLQPMVGRRWISCASCHPDGQSDGRTWKNPEGLRNTQSFAGLGRTHPVHWSADRDEVQDFEHTVRGLLMQGRGLIRGKVNPPLAAPNKGLSTDLDALAAYADSHNFTLSPHSKEGLSDAAERGREVFFSKQTLCATCHTGPLLTDSKPRPVDQIVRHDVGTGEDDPGEKMGPAYDTPTLLGLYRTGPWLHHGKAETLAEVFTKYNPKDRHGKTSHLAAEQVTDLVEFLKALPYEQPAQDTAQLVK
jgi:DNA-binding beta-propeller fold protein YncE